MNGTKLAVCLVALAIGAQAETFKVDTEHAEIGFTIRHLMLSDVKGGFNTFAGTIDYDLAGKNLKSIQGWIDAASIDTNSQKRDDHLKGTDFFNIERFPKMEFKSTSIEKTGEGTFKVTGKLSVLGVERTVVLPVKVNGPVDDPWGNKRIGLSCGSVLNRRDLGITTYPANMIGDEVNIQLNAEATFKPAGTTGQPQ